MSCIRTEACKFTHCTDCPQYEGIGNLTTKKEQSQVDLVESVRYIDADKLWDDRPLISQGKSMDYCAGFSECMWGFSKILREQIDNHSANVVEVVRCKNCRFASIDTEGSHYVSCLNPDVPWRRYKEEFALPPNHYCSYGKKGE